MATGSSVTNRSRPTFAHIPSWIRVAFLFSLLCGWPRSTDAADALILARDTQIRQAPQTSGKVIRVATAGETYEVPARRSGRAQAVYFLDERGYVWVKIQVNKEEFGFVRTDLAAIAREQYPAPRGNVLSIVNLRPTGDGGVSRELWLAQDDWEWTRRIATIEGKPVWASHGEWFICQVDSDRPIKDPAMDRMVERIEKYSADGRTRQMLASGSYPVLNEARGEIYFYRDVDDRGEAVPPGLFAVGVNGGALRPVHLLPERYKFWKEDGDFFVQAPPPILHAATHRIVFHAFEPMGSRVRFTVSTEGQFLELRRD
jgi:hypothetical protein